MVSVNLNHYKYPMWFLKFALLAFIALVVSKIISLYFFDNHTDSLRYGLAMILVLAYIFIDNLNTVAKLNRMQSQHPDMASSNKKWTMVLSYVLLAFCGISIVCVSGALIYMHLHYSLV